MEYDLDSEGGGSEHTWAEDFVLVGFGSEDVRYRPRVF